VELFIVVAKPSLTIVVPRVARLRAYDWLEFHPLTKLRAAERVGWCRWWSYFRDFDPNLASIRNEPEFKAVFAGIERDMARQRAALAARTKDAPLELSATTH